MRVFSMSALFALKTMTCGCEWRTAVEGSHISARYSDGIEYTLQSLAANGEKLLAAELDVVTKLTRTLDLTPSERSLAEYRIARAEAHLELARGKASLLAGEEQQARASFSKANSFLHSPRLTAVLLALRCSPRLARFTAPDGKKCSKGRRRSPIEQENRTP